MGEKKHNINEVFEIISDSIRKAGYSWHKVKNIEFAEQTKTWIAKVDVGIVNEDIKTIEIDDEDGEVINFK